MGSGVFVLTEIESIGDIFLLVLFVPKESSLKAVESKKYFGAQNPDFPS